MTRRQMKQMTDDRKGGGNLDDGLQMTDDSKR